ncbi:uracil-DNA glycosylase [Sutcliffiella cohnii]|uniref:Uracil-DNA glycosylase n=1 Tax=Sutcliffiella cohnii TaxID=33932 RepID=A0A223KWN2_9BACI|nr:uracil-DNA glycosylase [Sutcliffiella cohnii]AST93827.1 uracil-DNA glycosylase [Sutcliffiella cohnii]
MNCPVWNKLLREEESKPYYTQLMKFIDNEYKKYTVYPAKEQIFTSLEATPYEEVKVVIFGQDPYHGQGQAHGLSFSVLPGSPIPPSLRNMFKELEEDLSVPYPKHGYLLPWAKQGVLLLNTVLTVREGEANSHKGKGWETLTDQIIKRLNERKKPIVFILWGKQAQQKETLITNEHHYILKSVHPSPLSARRGFFGSKPFSKTNAFLQSKNITKIQWEI